MDSGQVGIAIGVTAAANTIAFNRVLSSGSFAVQLLSGWNALHDNLVLEAGASRPVNNPQGDNNSVSLAPPTGPAPGCPAPRLVAHETRVYLTKCHPTERIQRWRLKDAPREEDSAVAIEWLGHAVSSVVKKCLGWYTSHLLPPGNRTGLIPTLAPCGRGEWRLVNVGSGGGGVQIQSLAVDPAGGAPLCLASGGPCYGTGLVPCRTPAPPEQRFSVGTSDGRIRWAGGQPAPAVAECVAAQPTVTNGVSRVKLCN